MNPRMESESVAHMFRGPVRFLRPGPRRGHRTVLRARRLVAARDLVTPIRIAGQVSARTCGSKGVDVSRLTLGRA